MPANNGENKPNVKQNGRRPDLRRDAVLDPTIDFSAVAPSVRLDPAADRAVFLTGATGFLGAYLLYELLQQTQAKVYCLVRGESEEAGMERLYQKLAANLLWDASFRERIIPVPGDLARPRLGLSPQAFHQLAQEIDAVYHNGASVHFLQPYNVVKAANVGGTQEIIRLAALARAKPLHYLSTVFVFGPRSTNGSPVVGEEDHPGDGTGLLLGYFQSKWVAEQLVMQAGQRGLPVFVYRPGVLIGDSRTGVWDNLDDFFCRVIKGCIQLGMWPDIEADLPLTPVDYASKALVHLAQHPAPQRRFFHLVNPHPLRLELLFDWANSFGYSIRRAPLKVWQTQLVGQSAKQQGNVLAVLAPVLVARHFSSRAGAPAGGETGEPLARPYTLTEMYDLGKAPQFDCRNTLEGLAGSAIACPVLRREHFHRYFSYFIRAGFLAPPPAADGF